MSDTRGHERLLVEVKRLEAENTRLHEELRLVVAANAEARIEVARLRATLNDIAHQARAVGMPWLADIARAAIAKGEA